MPTAYRALALERIKSVPENYFQPEDFGYQFDEWVSPYTKGAHTLGSIAIVLQDWLGAEALTGPPNPDIQQFGRDRTRKTNKYLEELLSRIFELSITDVYVTNVFPFIKPGKNSSNISLPLMVNTARRFTKRELEIVNPKIVLAMGSKTHKALIRAGVDCYHLSHPARRGMNVDAHEKEWRQTLQNSAEI